VIEVSLALNVIMNDAVQKVEYFTMFMANVKIISVSPAMFNAQDPSLIHLNHLESIALMYDKITWKYCDGNIIYSDSWEER